MAFFDQAMLAFKREMQAQGLWDSVTIALSTDFARSGCHHPTAAVAFNLPPLCS